MNPTPLLIRKLSIDSASSIEFEEEDIGSLPVNKAFTRRDNKSKLDTIVCLLCGGDSGNTKCIACKGKGIVGRGSPFMQFIDAIYRFKLNGHNSSIQSAKILEVRKVSITRSVNLQRVRCSYVKKMSMVVEPTQHFSIHSGIQCDCCSQHPIKGVRWSCLVCQQFDLCSDCYERKDHPHEFKRVDVSKIHIQRRALQEYNRKSTLSSSEG